MAEDQWNETTHEWEKRLTLLVQQKRLATAQAHDLTVAIDRLVEDHVIDILPRNLYAHVEPIARRRILRDTAMINLVRLIPL